LICYGGQLAGELSVRRINLGSSRSAELGYWVDRASPGRIMPPPLAMGVDHCSRSSGCTAEAGIRTGEHPLRRVTEKLGFARRASGASGAYRGAWRDHLCYAITAEDVPGGMLSRGENALAASRSGREHAT